MLIDQLFGLYCLDSIISCIYTNDCLFLFSHLQVPFTEALDLVSRRKVYVQKGQAYVPYDDMISILLAVYRTHLSQALAVSHFHSPFLHYRLVSSLAIIKIGNTVNQKPPKVRVVLATCISNIDLLYAGNQQIMQKMVNRMGIFWKEASKVVNNLGCPTFL